MKIAYDAKRFFSNASGLGNYSRDLVRILAAHYPQHRYLLLNGDKTDRGRDILEQEPVEFRKTTKGTFARQIRMGRDAADAEADIFHGLSGELPLKWHPKKKIRKIVTIHDLIFLRYPEYYSFFDRKIHQWKFKKAAETCDLIIAISQQTADDIVRYLGVSAEKIRVVYQGCHQAFKIRRSDQELQAVAARFSLPEKFILSVGTVEPRKNLLNVLKAITGTGIPIVIIGKKQKTYWKKLQKLIDRNGLADQVILPEHVSMEDLAAIYQLADTMVYASQFEGFGIPVIEALFSGTPVITSNRSSLPEAGGEAVLYVDPLNADDIRAKIRFLWENSAERERRAELGLVYAQKFTDAEIAKNIMNVYEEVLRT